MTEAVRNGLLAIDMPRGKGRGIDQKMETGHSFRARWNRIRTGRSGLSGRRW